MIYWIKVRELWVLYRCVLRQFSVFPHIHAPILPTNYKKITKCFQCDYKTKTKLKHRTHYAIFQNRRICASCQLYGLVHYAACAFLPIYKWLAFCACEYSLSGCFMRSWLVWAVREREREHVWRLFVFIGVDVKYIIHYKRICKFICSL